MNTTQKAQVKADYPAIAKKLAETSGALILKLAERFNCGDTNLGAVSDPKIRKEILDAITVETVQKHKAFKEKSFKTNGELLDAKYQHEALCGLFEELRVAYGAASPLPNRTTLLADSTVVSSNILNLALAEFTYGYKPASEPIRD